jgi:hypothetical protein
MEREAAQTLDRYAETIDPACGFTWNAIVDASYRCEEFAQLAEERAREAS